MKLICVMFPDGKFKTYKDADLNDLKNKFKDQRVVMVAFDEQGNITHKSSHCTPESLAKILPSFAVHVGKDDATAAHEAKNIEDEYLKTVKELAETQEKSGLDAMTSAIALLIRKEYLREQALRGKSELKSQAIACVMYPDGKVETIQGIHDDDDFVAWLKLMFKNKEVRIKYYGEYEETTINQGTPEFINKFLKNYQAEVGKNDTAEEAKVSITLEGNLAGYRQKVAVIAGKRDKVWEKQINSNIGILIKERLGRAQANLAYVMYPNGIVRTIQCSNDDDIVWIKNNLSNESVAIVAYDKNGIANVLRAGSVELLAKFDANKVNTGGDLNQDVKTMITAVEATLLRFYQQQTALNGIDYLKERARASVEWVRMFARDELERVEQARIESDIRNDQIHSAAVASSDSSHFAGPHVIFAPGATATFTSIGENAVTGVVVNVPPKMVPFGHGQ